MPALAALCSVIAGSLLAYTFVKLGEDHALSGLHAAARPPAVTYTRTVTATRELPGGTRDVPGPVITRTVTVPAPAVTRYVDVPGPTVYATHDVQVPGPTVTVTVPAPAVTITVTVTAPPPATPGGSAGSPQG